MDIHQVPQGLYKGGLHLVVSSFIIYLIAFVEDQLFIKCILSSYLDYIPHPTN